MSSLIIGVVSSLIIGVLIGMILTLIALLIGRKTHGLEKLPKIIQKKAEIITSKDDIEEFLND